MLERIGMKGACQQGAALPVKQRGLHSWRSAGVDGHSAPWASAAKAVRATAREFYSGVKSPAPPR
jgi:hypothetical protein